MDTKRCVRCHKLLRADARSCSRCGYVFSRAMPVKRNGNATNGSRRTVTPSMPSNPPASLHRAGHYSGLHPEDQPFQSSFMPVQHARRPSAITHSLADHEPGEVILPALTDSPASSSLAHENERLPKRRMATPTPLLLPVPHRQLASSPLSQAPPVHQPIAAPGAAALAGPRKRQRHERAVPVLLFTSCILFLLATSILAFLLLDRRAAVITQPQLQLPASHIDLGAGGHGTSSHKTITLTNAGGGQINWQVQSDSTWLKITPNGDTFSGSEVAMIIVNRSNLVPHLYTGHITFSQRGSNTISVLTVTMMVNRS